MGLDVGLGVVILIAAIRGWLRGFTYQVVRIGGLIASVYLAAPVRDQVKPYIASYLPTIDPAMLERLLWWPSASVCYIVIVGTLTLAMKITKRPEIPGMPPQRSRNDQFAGFLLGIAKGGVIAAFLVAALEKYGMSHVETVPWVKEQTKGSQALAWNEQYHPAMKIWKSVPVRHFVTQVRRMGFPDSSTVSSPGNGEIGERPVVQTARRASEDGPGAASGHPLAQGGLPEPPASGRSPAKGQDSGSN